MVALFSPDIRVHVDNGVSAPNMTLTGDWGGAEVLGDADISIGNDKSCKGASVVRKGYFSHVLAKASMQNWGRCTAVGNGDPSTLAHEVGHYAGLMHWGNKDMKEGKLNCKPHYLSVMNYNYQWSGNIGTRGASRAWMGPGEGLPAFSAGLYKSLALNPTALDEVAGLRDATPNQAALEFLNGVLHLKVDFASGGVDWDGNGLIEAGSVQAMLNTPAGVGGDCDPSPPITRGSVNVARLAKPSLNAEASGLYVNGISTLLGRHLVVGARADVSSCAGKGTGPCASLSDSAATLVNADPAPGAFSPTVAGGVVVYADVAGNLHFFQKGSGGFPMMKLSVAPVGGPAISGDPVAVQRPSGLITVYAPSGGYLRRWDYDPAIKTWSTRGTTENWVPDPALGILPVETGTGIGMAWGYQLAMPGEVQPASRNLYAAIGTPDGAGGQKIVLARLDAQELAIAVGGSSAKVLVSRWVPLTNAAAQIPADASSVVASRIGLAFRPDDPGAAEPQSGRFYVTWQIDAGNIGGTCYENQPMFALSRGNYYSDVQDLASAPKTVVFDRGGRVGNVWTSWASGASLVYFEGNVRGVYQTAPEFARSCASPPVVHDPMASPRSSFFPNVDGIFNYDEYDHDDISYMKSHLSWALRQ